jgi:apolipoprotein N-acyltransferase
MAGLGALQTLAFVHTWAWVLPVVTLAGLVWRLDRSSAFGGALLAWSYGTGWLCAGTWWLFISMHRYGGLPAPLAGLAVLALAAALSLYLAAAGAAYARWRRGTVVDLGLFGGLWLLAELARGVIFTGFPWVASGYAQIDSPLAALAPWVGVYGIGLVVAALSAVLVRLVRWCAWRDALGLAALLLAVWFVPRDFTRSAGELSVELLQTNVQQDQKFAVEHMPQAMAWVAERLAASTANLVVAPETAVPLLPGQLEDFAPGYWHALETRFAVGSRAALVGVPLGDFERGYTNSVAGLSAASRGAGMYRYDKHHLVPFGEFIPTGFRWFTEMMNIPLGDFSRGVVNAPSFAVGAQRVGPNICYEDLFGEELAQRYGPAGDRPTVLANISNIGWFGDTVAIPQHLNITRMRTLELQRPMLRSTNTGATAVVDHTGRVTALLPPLKRGVLQGRVQGREGLTPFAWWASRAGLWPLVGLALLLLLAPWLAAHRGAS